MIFGKGERRRTERTSNENLTKKRGNSGVLARFVLFLSGMGEGGGVAVGRGQKEKLFILVLWIKTLKSK